MTTLRPLRLGLAGFGRWGRVLARNMAALPGVTGVIASTNPDTPSHAPPGWEVVADWRRMVETPSLDGVVVATPPASHGALARAALARGLPLLIEKPLTLDPAEARELAVAARQADALVMVDHVHLFSPAFRRLRDLATQHGPIRAIRGRAGNRGPYRSDASVLWDWGAHDVAMALVLLGRQPDTVSAERTAEEVLPEGRAEMITMRLGFGPVTVEAEIGTLMDKTRRFEVECAGATLLYDDVAADRLTCGGVAVPVDGTGPVAVVLAEFVQAIRTGRRDCSDLDLGAAVVEILARCDACLA